MQLTQALPTAAGGYSSALSLLALDFDQVMTFDVDAATGAAGTVAASSAFAVTEMRTGSMSRRRRRSPARR